VIDCKLIIGLSGPACCFFFK